eukprot:TRINITY_DN6632_c0_g1_i2.p1 TRINITY_DN6632_c0_g1~~TRINITY_DN6632_c0_g1_i2.p1  ORF type:complete len:458 (+),score=144.14 TRINITY_DN6632_c0_g1_i2:82-1455(+)
MAFQLRPRPRTSLATRLAAGGCLLAAVRHFGPTYTVKGSWEGTLADIRSLPQGLEPSSVGGVSLTADTFGFSLEDGVLEATYADGPLSLKIDDSSEWEANFTQDDTKVKFNGQGMGKMVWEASKVGSVEGVGELVLDLSSGGDIDVTLTPTEWNLGGVGLEARTQSGADGLAVAVAAAKSLNEDVGLNYKVENDVGDYDIAHLKHAVGADARVAGGTATAAYTYDDAGHNYNATFTRDIAGGAAHLEYADGADGRAYNVTFGRSYSGLAGADGDLTIGADVDGVYSALSASRELGDLSATLDVSGRVDPQAEDIAHTEALKLAHKLGSVTISSEDGMDVDLEGDFALEQAGNKLAAKVGYTVGDSDVSYNVSFSRDLDDLIQTPGAVEVGLDDVGPYGSLSASKSISDGALDVAYSSSGRLDDLEHKVKVSNDLGYAELVKAQDEEPRLRLGYEFDV